MAKDDGGYAEPSMMPVDLSGGFAHAMEALDIPTREARNREYRGMTMRQWYAGLAMMGIICGHEIHATEALAMPNAAERAFRMADAMIAEEKKA